MVRKLSVFAAFAVLGLMPAQLMAGGPPRLCLPMNGVTADNADACAKRLGDALGNKLWSHAGMPGKVQIHHDEKQFYVMCHLEKPVALSDVEAALKGSGFSIPRDKLHLFGHVILQIDPGTTSPDTLIAELAKVDYVSVEESKREQGMLLVTVDMPYPEIDTTRSQWKSFAEVVFRRNDFSSNASRRSESPANSCSLPSYSALRDIVAKHDARLNDIRWSSDWGCRMLGGVAAADTDAEARVAGR